jgi:hypothetical protein
VVVAVALTVTVYTEPLARPASLKFTTRLAPESEAEVAFLMKWGLPCAKAGTAARANAISDSTAMMPIFLIKDFLLFLDLLLYPETVVLALSS